MALPISVLALDIDGVITDGRVLFDSAGEESKLVSYPDIDAVFSARRRGLKVILITAEDTPWVDFISARLEIENTISGAKDKAQAIYKMAEQLGVSLEQICYVGDSDRDAPALKVAGLGLAPANATLKAKAAADMVLESAGGRGAVYEALAVIEKHILAQENNATRMTAKQSFSIDESILTETVSQVYQIISESISALQAMAKQQAENIARAAVIVIRALQDGHKLLVFGNGGSAADAQHLVAEFVGRFETERSPLAAIALTTDTSILTAIANDYGQEAVFARQIEAIGQSGDVVIAISTSGNSPNVLGGVRKAQQLGMPTIGMTGRTGGKLAKLVDLCLSVPVDKTSRIQEAHGVIIHVLCGLVEADVVPN